MNEVKLLVSVRNVSEAATALAGGADIIDVKEPANGPLGMAEANKIHAIAQAVGGRTPVSVAMGELASWKADRPMHAGPGINFAKVGLADMDGGWPRKLTQWMHWLGPVRPVAVAYADAQRVGAPDLWEIVHWIRRGEARDAARANLWGILIDTAVKDERGLFDWLDASAVRDVIGQCASAGLGVALAGSLRGETFTRAALLGPAIVAVRGAACEGGGRQGRVELERVRQLKQTLAEARAEGKNAAGEWRFMPGAACSAASPAHADSPIQSPASPRRPG